MAKQATCHTCVYAHWDPGLWVRTLWSGFAAWPTCGNQPDSYGRMKECTRGKVCRNYRAKPPGPEGEGVKMIPLGEGLYTYVDAVDYEWLNQWRWRLCGRYAARRQKGKLIFMHREIMRPPPGKVTDHANGNKLDNTRINLRNTTPRQNVHNRCKRFGCTSIYKGVGYHKRRHRWYASIRLGKEYFHLGYFDSEAEAARVYDYKAAELFGEFARPNFPEEWPAERVREVHAEWQREQAKQRRKARAGGENTRARAKSPAGEGRKRATRDGKGGTKRPSRRTRSRVPR
jgi:hypothetical protein